MTNPVIEAMARAICLARLMEMFPEEPSDNLQEIVNREWQVWEPETRAALQDPRYLQYCAELDMPERPCGVTGCVKKATHTWSGHPTCDDCATPSRKEQDSKEEEESVERIAPLDLRAINRKLAGHNEPLRGDTSSGPAVIMTKSRHTITV